MPCSTVMESVVESGLCVGCGSCAAACPRGRLAVEMCRDGLYTVRRKEDSCPDRCGLCLRVCPFGDGNPNEDQLAEPLYSAVHSSEYVPVLGHVVSSWAGCSLTGGQRLSGASGGLTTWFLSELLRQGVVDRVACVGPHPGSAPLFQYTLCETSDQVERASRSAYYPVEMSEVLSNMQCTDARYAVVCLPCFAKALRLAASALPKVARRIVCVAGLVCGHTVSTRFAEYAARLAGAGPETPRRVTFRTKSPDRPATELGIECEWGPATDTSVATVLWSQGPGEAWSEQWFTPNPCLYCDDVFAETADVAFMDAWLPKYEADYRGTNLVLARSALSDWVIRSGIESGAVRLEPCPLGDVVRSQSAAVVWKRDALAHRLWLAAQEGRPVPAKRVEPRFEEDGKRRSLCEGRVKASRMGLAEWLDTKEPEAFRQRMRKYSGWMSADPQPTRRAGIGARILGRLKRLV